MTVLQSNMLYLAALLCCQLLGSKVEGLAFVTAAVNPIAALRAVNPFTTGTGGRLALQAHNNNNNNNNNNGRPSSLPKVKARHNAWGVNDRNDDYDDTTRMMEYQRNLIVDLVYERSIDRMNSFSAE